MIIMDKSNGQKRVKLIIVSDETDFSEKQIQSKTNLAQVVNNPMALVDFQKVVFFYYLEYLGETFQK